MGSMKLKSFALVVGLVGAAVPGQAACAQSVWDSVATVLQTPATVVGGYHRYGFPRSDLTVRVGDVTIAPALALGAWVGFTDEPHEATMMGDLVVTAAELGPLLAELARQRLEVHAIHNHVVREVPEVVYVHFHGHGAPLDLATRLDRALAKTATPRPVRPAGPQPVRIDSAKVFRVLGTTGRAQGNIAQVGFVLVPGEVRMGGRLQVPALAYNSPVNIQMVDDIRAAATGDFAVLGEKVDALLDSLAAHGIVATAMHSHLIGESPRVYYIHFWGDAPLDALLAGLRAAVDAAR
jgi:Domain of Unknown Function (DUF1259)